MCEAPAVVTGVKSTARRDQVPWCYEREFVAEYFFNLDTGEFVDNNPEVLLSRLKQMWAQHLRVNNECELIVVGFWFTSRRSRRLWFELEEFTDWCIFDAVHLIDVMLCLVDSYVTKMKDTIPAKVDHESSDGPRVA